MRVATKSHSAILVALDWGVDIELRALEPFPGTHKPEKHDQDEDASDGHGRIIQCRFRHRVDHGQAKDHSNGDDPQHRDPAHKEAVSAKVEWARAEGWAPNRDAEEDGQCVRDVESNCGDRNHRLESHQAPQWLHTHNQSTNQPITFEIADLNNARNMNRLWGKGCRW